MKQLALHSGGIPPAAWDALSMPVSLLLPVLAPAHAGGSSPVVYTCPSLLPMRDDTDRPPILRGPVPTAGIRQQTARDQQRGPLHEAALFADRSYSPVDKRLYNTKGMVASRRVAKVPAKAERGTYKHHMVVGSPYGFSIHWDIPAPSVSVGRRRNPNDS